MKNEYEMTVDVEIAMDLLAILDEQERETAELDELKYLDSEDYDR